MGYYSEVYGPGFSIEPPLNKDEHAFVSAFIVGTQNLPADTLPLNLRDQNDPANPLWLCTDLTNEGDALTSPDDSAVKAYSQPEAIELLLQYLAPQQRAEIIVLNPEFFKAFTFNHRLNGWLGFYGEDSDDRWELIVEDNVVRVRSGQWTWNEPAFQDKDSRDELADALEQLANEILLLRHQYPPPEYHPMSTITPTQEQSIRERLAATPNIPVGKGTEEAACSIATINLALYGVLTDEIPECMSEVIGQWIIVAQDAMPSRFRNSPEWRALLPLAAGTGRRLEQERLSILMNHMWTVALPSLQFFATQHGFGPEWAAMCRDRSPEAAEAAAEAAAAETAAATESRKVAIFATADAARMVAEMARTRVGVQAAKAMAGAAAKVAAKMARAMACRAQWLSYKAARTAENEAWKSIGPVELLERLIERSD